MPDTICGEALVVDPCRAAEVGLILELSLQGGTCLIELPACRHEGRL